MPIFFGDRPRGSILLGALSTGAKPSWLVSGPDGAWPVQVSAWSDNAGYVGGRVYSSASAYLAAAGGTFSRASDATFFDVGGILRVAGPNVLRLDYDPLSGAPLGLRVEGQRTNYSARSSQFDLHNQQRVTVVPNYRVAPNGLLEADKIIPTNVLATHNIYSPNIGTTVADSTIMTASTFLHAEELSRASVNAGNSNTDLWVRGGFNLATGLDLSNQVMGTGASLVAKRGTLLRDGWGRYAVTVNTGTQTPREMISSVSMRDNSDVASFLGDGVSGIGAWGSQLEIAPFASSYIPNPSAGSAIRLADALSYPAAAPSEATIVIDAYMAPGFDTALSQCVYHWGDGSANNRLRIYRDLITGKMVLYSSVGGATNWDTLSNAVAAPGEKVKIALSLKAGAICGSVNGTGALTYARAAPIPSGMTTIHEGLGFNNSEHWFGTIARVSRYAKAYSPSELQAMSS